jgi:hypothetical protein
MNTAATETRLFPLRLRATHKGEFNEIATLSLERATDDGWAELELHTDALNFWWLPASVFLCHHKYLTVNLAELGHQVSEVSGELLVRADGLWMIETISSDFEYRLRAGRLAADEEKYIVGRMAGCPVSRNLALAKKQVRIVPMGQAKAKLPSVVEFHTQAAAHL